MTGATIIRGPMASNHFTQVHNWIARGGLPVEYVGVYVYIASHRDGWRLTEEQLAEHLGKGRAYVRSALKAMERALLLVRERERLPGGTLGKAMWWVSDLAPQLRQLGLDEASIRQQVDKEAERCLRSEPMFDYRTLASTSADERLRRSEPKFDEPTLVHRTTEEEQGSKEDQKPPPPSSSIEPSRAAPVAAQEEEEEEAEPRSESRAAAGAAQAIEVVQGLTWSSEPSPTQRNRLLAAVARSLAAGHSADVITAELERDLASARSVPEVRVSRADALAGEPPAAAVREPLSNRPPWCGRCTSDARRLVEDGDEPYRCPDCNPLARPRRREADAHLSQA